MSKLWAFIKFIWILLLFFLLANPISNYDDEYDDTYDDAAVVANDADSVDELGDENSDDDESDGEETWVSFVFDCFSNDKFFWTNVIKWGKFLKGH